MFLPERAFLQRFRRDLDELAPAGTRLGIAVSGGPDSLALLLLAAAARPDDVQAATVDHDLRSGSRDEARMVAGICDHIGVAHTVLTANWSEHPRTAVQERARDERYRLLDRWCTDRGVGALVTAHHADDQAETLIMRLNRGAGVRGLAAMRPRNVVPRSTLPLLRPLLSWRRVELAQVCADAGLTPANDPSNADEQFERVRVRSALGAGALLDPAALALSARHLAAADEALDWCVEQEWRRGTMNDGTELTYEPSDAPPEVLRRLLVRAVGTLAQEGTGEPLRGREVGALLATLKSGDQATLRGVLCRGGTVWRFTTAPPRNPTAD